MYIHIRIPPCTYYALHDKVDYSSIGVNMHEEESKLKLFKYALKIVYLQVTVCNSLIKCLNQIKKADVVPASI